MCLCLDAQTGTSQTTKPLFSLGSCRMVIYVTVVPRLPHRPPVRPTSDASIADHLITFFIRTRMQAQGGLYHGAFTPITAEEIEGYVWERVALSGNCCRPSLARRFLAFAALTPALGAARFARF